MNPYLDEIEQYHRLHRVLPDTSSLSPSEVAREAQLQAMKDAFHQEDRGRDVAKMVHDQIVKFLNDYNSGGYFSPYTSLIGPSGIGKSFLVKQMAYQNRIYIVYASLGIPAACCYPGRSAIADLIGFIHDRPAMIMFFECYIVASLVHVELCKDFGITAAAFFDLQVDELFAEFQTTLSKHVMGFYNKVNGEYSIKQGKGGRRERSDQDWKPFDYQGYIDEFLEEYKSDVRYLFRQAREQLRSSEKYAHYISESRIEMNNGYNEPSVLICFDEAQELISDWSYARDMRFCALRRAMRNQTCLGFSKDIKKRCDVDRKRFFGLLLDTVTRISDPSPQDTFDPSLKAVSDRHVFPPIYQIDSMNVFVDDAADSQYHPDQLIGARVRVMLSDTFFPLGDPCGVLCWKNTVCIRSQSWPTPKSVVAENLLVVTDNGDETEALALISYRMNFDVALFSLAEKLTSGYLRCIVDINVERTLLRTTQPSEPIIAFLSADKTLHDRDSRVRAVKALYKNTTKGFIHLGDIGEAVAALVLLFTFDKVHHTVNGRWPAPVKLSTFISILFPSSKLGMIERCMTDKREMQSLWENGYVFFNHFVRLSESSPTAKTLKRAYDRGAAIFPPLGYKGCDIIIPVSLRGQQKMTYLIIQVKNRRNDSLTNALRNEAKEALKSAAGLLLTSSPHLGILMSLRSREGQQEMDVVYPLERPAQRPPSGRQGKKMGDTNYVWNDMNRVVIAAVGMGVDLYPGVGFGHRPENEPQTVEMVQYLNSLLDQTAEMPTKEENSYYEYLLSPVV
ncbi:hypothetical protein VTN96DRAFT_6838 [Rasamsonia emersonii]